VQQRLMTPVRAPLHLFFVPSERPKGTEFNVIAYKKQGASQDEEMGSVLGLFGVDGMDGSGLGAG
jgi:hypothetical protein